MTIDKSLRIKSGSAKQRNVLKRGERLAKLKEMDRWSEGGKILGLPKVRVLKLSMKKKKKTKAEGEEGAAAAPAAAKAAAGKAPAAKAPAAKAPAAKAAPKK